MTSASRRAASSFDTSVQKRSMSMLWSVDRCYYNFLQRLSIICQSHIIDTSRTYFYFSRSIPHK